MNEHRLLRCAAGLLSEDGENPEYDRAITELTCEMLGLNTDAKDHVHQLLRAVEL